uniref:Uncharacterized protein n=1 Tax=Mycobacterium riyadhense TaxID=486698 RepID=A0A653EXC6_9MYCO|nr:hypothetical protein BIN_B_04322 [Mycobacterium riyadhense]
MSSDETIIAFTHDDGRLIEIDHLGIMDPDNPGEFAIYEGDKQIGEFMLPSAIEYSDIKAPRELSDDEELVAQAKLALACCLRVLTQHEVVQMFTDALGLVDRRCRSCGCTDSAACDRITGAVRLADHLPRHHRHLHGMPAAHKSRHRYELSYRARRSLIDRPPTRD